MNSLTLLELDGYKSIKNVTLRFGRINVLIGANGAGKSNLISFFELLNYMTFAPDQLQLYVGKSGGANAILFDGAAVTPQIHARLCIDTEAGQNEYEIRLFHAAPDTLIFAEERFRFNRTEMASEPPWTSLGSGHRESKLYQLADEGNMTAKVILELLKRLRVYQFHDTSDTANVKSRWILDDAQTLRHDGANLAPFLYRMRESKPKYYRRIVETVRGILPFFVDFELAPTAERVLLQWRERDSDLIFGPHQASDGTIRMIALVTLLLQPPESLPNLIILDEPELGLHPYAIQILAGMIKAVSVRSQVIVATQSAMLLDYFEPEDVIVVDRVGRDTHFSNLPAAELEEWLAEYSLSELWEKNVLGGRPA